LATFYNDIGVIYDHLGNFDKGLEAKLEALKVFQTELGEMHISTAAGYNNVGISYENKQEYRKSLQFKEKALSILK
jgi:tetratricopeptide (TPR) repeat protein